MSVRLISIPKSKPHRTAQSWCRLAASSGTAKAQRSICTRRIYQTLIRNEYANDWRTFFRGYIYFRGSISVKYNRSEFSYDSLICRRRLCRCRWCVREVNNVIRLIQAYLVRKCWECVMCSTMATMVTAYAVFSVSFLFRFFVSFAFAFIIIIARRISSVFEIERMWDKSPAITHVIERFDAWAVSVCKAQVSPKCRSTCALTKCGTHKHIKIQFCCRVGCRYTYYVRVYVYGTVHVYICMVFLSLPSLLATYTPSHICTQLRIHIIIVLAPAVVLAPAHTFAACNGTQA